MLAPAFWGVPHGGNAQEFPNPAYGAKGPTHPHSVKSVSLDADAQEAPGAAAGGAKPNPAAPVDYPLDLSPLLEAILQMCDSQLEFQQMMLENGSTSS